MTFFALLALLATSAACGGDDGGAPSTTGTPTAAATATVDVSALIDIKDFETAHFIVNQTSITDGETSELGGEGVIDNRQEAMRADYEAGQFIAIGPTIYEYSRSQQRWLSFTDEREGRVGFGRPYWPQFWLDAVKIDKLGGRTLEGVEATAYRVTFDNGMAGERLKSPAATEPLDVRKAEVEVWVDNDSRYAVRMILRLEMVVSELSTQIEATSDLSDFDAEVQIVAPDIATPTPAATGAAPTPASP
jgi:hypothetical protein